MKKASLLVVALLVALFCTSASAQAPDLKYIGVRVGLGTYLGTGLPLGASFEMPMKSMNPNLAVGAQFMYLGYSEEFPGWGGTYGWDYTNLMITAFGAYYYDLLKMEKLKTYGKVHLGWNIASVEYKSAIAGFSYSTPNVGGLIYGLNVGAKYLLTSNLAATVEVGYGMSILTLGVDYGF